jgi:hypothetical protein
MRNSDINYRSQIGTVLKLIGDRDGTSSDVICDVLRRLNELGLKFGTVRNKRQAYRYWLKTKLGESPEY